VAAVKARGLGSQKRNAEDIAKLMWYSDQRRTGLKLENADLTILASKDDYH
jgi:hypothetical protein